MREVDHANAVTKREVLGVRDFPEVAVVPLGFTGRHLITVLGQQRILVGRIAIGTFPASHFHKVAAEGDFTLIEGAHSKLARGRVGLARVNRRGVDLLRDFVASIADELVRQLDRIVPRWINAVRIHLGATVGHPVGQQFASARAIFHPDGLTEPQIFNLRRLTNNRTAVGSHREQSIK